MVPWNSNQYKTLDGNILDFLGRLIEGENCNLYYQDYENKCIMKWL